MAFPSYFALDLSPTVTLLQFTQCMNPALNQPQWQPNQAKTELGYKFSQSDHAMENALLKALDYLRAARWNGAETREWAKITQEDLRKKMGLVKDHNSDASLIQRLREINEWETSLKKSIQDYMYNSTERLSKMRLLNPPLSTENLRPFLDAIEKDRLLTISTLRPLVEMIDQLALLRERLRERRLPFTNYNPTY